MAFPRPELVANAGGQTLVTNAGSNGKFLGVLDFDVQGGKVAGHQYRLLPVFADALPADAEMQSLIERVRQPYLARLDEPLAVTDDLLFRRGNFNGSFDQLILDALLAVKDAEIAFSPGFRWGTSLLPGDTIRMEQLMDQTAITYPHSTLTQMKGSMVKTILEDVADNLFNADPYYQQGGDMVRVGGMDYAIEPAAASGQRIRDMTLNGKPIEPDKTYKVAGWAPVAANAQGEPIWDVVATWLRDQKRVSPRRVQQPRLIGISNNDGNRSLMRGSPDSGVFAEDAQHFSDAVLAIDAVGHADDFRLQRARHHFKKCTIKRIAHRRQLLGNFVAGLFVFDHPEHAANLAFSALEAQHDAALVLIAPIAAAGCRAAFGRRAGRVCGSSARAWHGGSAISGGCGMLPHTPRSFLDELQAQRAPAHV